MTGLVLHVAFAASLLGAASAVDAGAIDLASSSSDAGVPAVHLEPSGSVAAPDAGAPAMQIEPYEPAGSTSEPAMQIESFEPAESADAGARAPAMESFEPLPAGPTVRVYCQRGRGDGSSTRASTRPAARRWPRTCGTGASARGSAPT